MNFPINLDAFHTLKFSLSQNKLTVEEETRLKENIQLVRDTIVFFTAYANTKGLGGHTGGAYDIVPEVLIIDGFIKGSDKVYPVYFDEAGHRVAIQYLMAVLNGFKPPESLLHYREFGSGLYGHPERDDDQGIFFSSGRLGHLWSYINGVASSQPDKTVVLFGSDGSQQEGVDDMADNTCHFGINNFFSDNGVPENDATRLYFPADSNQQIPYQELGPDHIIERIKLMCRSGQ
jgi:transketolase N-terminal domain/subunit